MPKIGEKIVQRRQEESIKPFWATSDGEMVRLYLGNVTDVLAKLPPQSVHMCVTSPPYWGLRDYGVDGQLGAEPSPDCGTQGQAQCGRCFVCAMVAVFRGVHRVMRDDGTLWLNLGDTYAGSSNSGGTNSKAIGGGMGQSSNKGSFQDTPRPKIAIPSGNLIGIPWRVALALQADGWILRQDIIWHKPSTMPESVGDRCTKAHEYVFLFAKAKGYYYDAEAIKERSLRASRNKRSVWSVSSQGYEGAHFAVYPPKLIEPMIKAGTSEKGCCAKCGTSWRRIVEEKQLTRERPNDYVKYADVRGVKSGKNFDRNDGERSNVSEDKPRKHAATKGRLGKTSMLNSCANSVAGVETKTIGWEPSCECGTDVVPCVVLDPFIGSGTTCCVSLGLGRRSVGIDLSEKYLKRNAVVRIEGELMARPKLSYLTGRQRKPIECGEDLDLS